MATRRSPAPGERTRDAERSKAVILDAALHEFGEHGFAGARTIAIARRAGVNPQLISYYFDGKAGLYKALAQRWQEQSGELSGAEQSLEEVVASFVRMTVENRSWARLLVWEGLTSVGPSHDEGDGNSGSNGFFTAMVDGLRGRQERGELSSELDPGTVLLVFFSAALAPVSLPQVVERVTGTTASSPEFIDDYIAHLGAVVRRLR